MVSTTFQCLRSSASASTFLRLPFHPAVPVRHLLCDLQCTLRGWAYRPEQRCGFSDDLEPMDTVCGTVNAKNSDGNYNGSKKFVYFIGDNQVYVSGEGQDPELDTHPRRQFLQIEKPRNPMATVRRATVPDDVLASRAGDLSAGYLRRNILPTFRIKSALSLGAYHEQH
jgi:hypothetical protein